MEDDPGDLVRFIFSAGSRLGIRFGALKCHSATLEDRPINRGVPEIWLIISIGIWDMGGRFTFGSD